MKKTLFSALLVPIALAVACSGQTETLAPVTVPEYTIEQFLGTTNYRGASFSADNSRVLVSSDRSGIYNAYAIPTTGGDPQQLTDSEESVFIVSYFPGDDRFLYSADRAGDERDHVYVRETDGTVVDLTPGDGLKAGFLGWTAAGDSLFVTTNERDERYFDVYEIRADGYERTLVYENNDGYQPTDISADGRYVALVKMVTRTESDIFVFDRRTGSTARVTESAEDVANRAPTFGNDGSTLYYTTDEGREFQALMSRDLAGEESAEVLSASWDVFGASVSSNGKYLAVRLNEDARTRVRLFERETMEEIELPELPGGDVTSVGFSRDETALALYLSSSRRPRDLWVYTLGGDSPRRLTDSLNPEVDPEHLVDAQVVRFDSYDGVTIPGVLYKPYQANATNQAPALVWVHGGPGGQSRLGYSGLLQYLVNHGYVVYAINNRGSSGYGKTFQALDDRRHGEGDLGDCIASKEMLIATGYVDPERIGIIGGSYGGYMVLAALTLQPEEFAAGVDLFGISNWVRTLESIPPWWESIRESLYNEMGDPAVDGERLRRISPLFHADEIVRPLMVLQGATDPRVHQVESDDIVEAARANGVPVEYVVFPDEGHGFVKKENQERGYRAIVEFLDQYLKGTEPAAGEQAAA